MLTRIQTTLLGLFVTGGMTGLMILPYALRHDDAAWGIGVTLFAALLGATVGFRGRLPYH